MKKTPLKRKTPLKANPDAIKSWKNKSRSTIKPKAAKRKVEERDYSAARRSFIARHPRCPVTWNAATEIHHSSRRTGKWIGLTRYWIALSSEGHRIVEDNGKWAESVGLMVRIRETYDDHVRHLEEAGESLDIPVFYLRWDGQLLKP